MGCMSSKALEEPDETKQLPEISWPTKCYYNPGVLPSTLAIGYPYPYPDGYPNTPPPFPIPDYEETRGLVSCDYAHALRPRRYSSMENRL